MGTLRIRDLCASGHERKRFLSHFKTNKQAERERDMIYFI